MGGLVPGIDAQAELRSWLSEEIGSQGLGVPYRFEVSTRIRLAGTDPDVTSHEVSWRLVIWRANPHLGQAPLRGGFLIPGPVPPQAITPIAPSGLAPTNALPHPPTPLPTRP